MLHDNYQVFLEAKKYIKKRDYQQAEIILKRLNSLEPNDYIIKFELAKIYVKKRKTRDKGKKILMQLLDTPNKNYAMLELGKLESSEGNNEKAREYFKQLLNAQNKTYAMLELGD